MTTLLILVIGGAASAAVVEADLVDPQLLGPYALTVFLLGAVTAFIMEKVVPGARATRAETATKDTLSLLDKAIDNIGEMAAALRERNIIDEKRNTLDEERLRLEREAADRDERRLSLDEAQTKATQERAPAQRRRPATRC